MWPSLRLTNSQTHRGLPDRPNGKTTLGADRHGGPIEGELSESRGSLGDVDLREWNRSAVRLRGDRISLPTPSVSDMGARQPWERLASSRIRQRVAQAGNRPESGGRASVAPPPMGPDRRAGFRRGHGAVSQATAQTGSSTSSPSSSSDASASSSWAETMRCAGGGSASTWRISAAELCRLSVVASRDA
jgi:hypothetical protein